ncbi:MAG: hypothetical protein CVT89_05925, partial [Candidatus Altiarchaeales archaeon HGW-Altiarchaeales-2]
TKDKYVNYFEKVNISGKTQINAGLYRKVYNLFNPSGYEIFTNVTTVLGYISKFYYYACGNATNYYSSTYTLDESSCSCPGYAPQDFSCRQYQNSRWGLKDINPNDEQLRKYSYTYPNYYFYNYTQYNNSFLNISYYGYSADEFVPEFSSQYPKEDVAKEMMIIVGDTYPKRGYITNYDDDCVSSYCKNGTCDRCCLSWNNERCTQWDNTCSIQVSINGNLVDKYCGSDCEDTICEAWHASDYEIINKTEGVCDDWAALTVSFAASYGLPVRYINIWWDDDKDGFIDMGHAFVEIFNVTNNETWVHLDTLWDEYNNPSVYGQSFMACAYYPNGTLMEDVSLKYDGTTPGNCWDFSWAAGQQSSATSAPGSLPKNFTPGNHSYKITIKTNTTAEFNAIMQLSSTRTNEINAKYNNGTLNDTELKQEIIDTLGLQNITPITLTKENLNDTSKQIILNAVFDVQIVNYTFSHNFVTSQFDRLKYIVNSNV